MQHDKLSDQTPNLAPSRQDGRTLLLIAATTVIFSYFFGEYLSISVSSACYEFDRATPHANHWFHLLIYGNWIALLAWPIWFLTTARRRITTSRRYSTWFALFLFVEYNLVVALLSIHEAIETIRLGGGVSMDDKYAVVTLIGLVIVHHFVVRSIPRPENPVQSRKNTVISHPAMIFLHRLQWITALALFGSVLFSSFLLVVPLTLIEFFKKHGIYSSITTYPLAAICFVGAIVLPILYLANPHKQNYNSRWFYVAHLIFIYLEFGSIFNTCFLILLGPQGVDHARTMQTISGFGISVIVGVAGVIVVTLYYAKKLRSFLDALQAMSAEPTV